MSIELFRPEVNRPGFLVTIDGPNGSGKTALAESLAGNLDAAGVEVFGTRQPSPSPFGDYVRDAEMDVTGRSLACLVAADRQRQVEVEIEPHLRVGDVVLCDRYVESSLVLQRLDGVDVDFILAINSQIPRPDFRIRLRASPDVLRSRLEGREPDPRRRFEQSAGPERELGFYDEADRLLLARYGVATHGYDTTATKTKELGLEVARQVLAAKMADA